MIRAIFFSAVKVDTYPVRCVLNYMCKMNDGVG